MTGQLSDFLAAHAERVADVMRRTGAEVPVAEEERDGQARLPLWESAADEMALIGRRLASSVTATLASRLSTMTTSSSARGTSMSITMHELRRPLTILNSYGQLLSTGMLGQLPETAMGAIEGITAS